MAINKELVKLGSIHKMESYVAIKKEMHLNIDIWVEWSAR